MPTAIPAPIRHRIWHSARAGQKPVAIAQALRISVRTVRHLLRNLEEHGRGALENQYGQCGRPATSQPPPLTQEALDLRAAHPSWGAGLIRVYLRRRHPAETLPSTRTLQRWFRRTCLPEAPAGRRPAAQAERARFPHEVWQIDAADQVRMRTGQCCWLRCVDECSGAFLRTIVFPPGVLGTRSRRRGPTRVAPGFRRMGTPPTFARGQWQTVGIGERFAASLGAVVDRSGNRDDLEPAARAAEKRRGGT